MEKHDVVNLRRNMKGSVEGMKLTRKRVCAKSKLTVALYPLYLSFYVIPHFPVSKVMFAPRSLKLMCQLVGLVRICS